jgi:protein phosphatase 1L
MIGAAAEARQDQGAATEASPSAGDTLARLTAACGVTSNVKLDSPIAVGDRELFVDACALQGKRPYMEDRFSIAQEQSGAPLVIGVFDGHGGFQVAQALAENLPLALIRSLRVSGTSEAQVAAAISRCFLEADAAVVRDDAAQRAPNAPGPGSTAAVAVVFSNTIWLCNVGDARAVLADEAGAVIAETADQTPSVPEERARLLMRGATVSTNVYDRKPRACGVLAISRAFGNKGLKQYITADPVVQRVQLPRSGCSLLIASDGLFDVISSAEAVRTLHVRARAPAATLAVRARSHKRAVDNITAVVVRIGPLPATPEPGGTQQVATQPPERPESVPTQPSQPAGGSSDSAAAAGTASAARALALSPRTMASKRKLLPSPVASPAA